MSTFSAVPGDIELKLLSLFPDTDFLGVARQYDIGTSRAPVVIAEFNARTPLGLSGSFVVKFGETYWGERERKLYERALKGGLRSVLAPIQSVSSTLDGNIAVAYSLAFNRLIRTRTLRQLLTQGGAKSKFLRTQIRQVAHSFANWNREDMFAGNSPLAPHLHIAAMLGRRNNDLLERLRNYLPIWDTNSPRIRIDALPRIFPNPLAYLSEELWENVNMRFACPRGTIHGDLHTDNIICLPDSSEQPKVIDFAEWLPNGYPLFDLAYLEFDIIQQTLGLDDEIDRWDWIYLLNFCMKRILPKGVPRRGVHASESWKLVKPIRRQVYDLQQRHKREYADKCEIAWWLATVVVGLNFARKGDHSQPITKRFSGLIYATYGLDRLLRLIEPRHPDADPPSNVPWIDEASRMVMLQAERLHVVAPKAGFPLTGLAYAGTTAGEALRVRVGSIAERLSALSALVAPVSVYLWQPHGACEGLVQNVRSALKDALTARGDIGIMEAARLEAQTLPEGLHLLVMIIDDNDDNVEQAESVCSDLSLVDRICAFVPVERAGKAGPGMENLADRFGVNYYVKSDLGSGRVVARALRWIDEHRLI